MQYTPHYNLNLPEGSDIVNPLIQDNPNYSAIDTALYANKLRVIGTATELASGTVHALTRNDTDISAFKFVATADFNAGDTFTVDGVSVTARLADGTAIPSGAYKINSTVLCELNGTILNMINVNGTVSANQIPYNNGISGMTSNNVQDAIDELSTGTVYYTDETVTTDGNGYADIRSSAPVAKTVSVTVLDPTRNSCELYINTAGASGYYAYIYSRGQSPAPVADTTVTLRIWRIK